MFANRFRPRLSAGCRRNSAGQEEERQDTCDQVAHCVIVPVQHFADVRADQRIAEGADANLVKLLRVDYSEEAGTTYQPAPIDEYGTIEWPEGFFEEASDEAFKILGAGLAKQAAQEG